MNSGAKRRDIVIDTSIAWAVANHRMQKALRRFFGALREEYIVCYTEHTLVELAATGYSGFLMRSILDSIAGYRKTGITRDRITRYKAAARIGPNDVAIALAASYYNAVLATGDWHQASYFMSLSKAKPLYIPVKSLP